MNGEYSAGMSLRTKETKLFDINKEMNYWQRVLDTAKTCRVELNNMQENAQLKLDKLKVKYEETVNNE